MPLDPNAPTSDIGQMYRDFLQSKGVPLTQENMQRAIAQSQREPGMIAGLSVQQPGGMQADAPPNVASAAPNSSGTPPPTPRAVPLNLPQGNQPPVSAPPSMAASGGQALPQQPPTPTQGDALSNTPPPGQAPGSGQIANIINMALPLLATAGGLGGIYGLNRSPSAAPPGAATPAPAPAPVGPRAVGRQITGADIVGPEVQGPPRYPPMQSSSGSYVNGVKPVGREIQGPPTGPSAMQGPPEHTATSPIGNIVAEKIEGPQQPFVHGVNPVGKEVQGPPMGPPPTQGPPEHTASSPIGNILAEKPTTSAASQIEGVKPIGPEIQGPHMGPPPVQGPPTEPPTFNSRGWTGLRGARMRLRVP